MQTSVYLLRILFVAGIQKRQDVGTAVICNIFDTNGELASAVASVEAIVCCSLMVLGIK